LKNLKKKLNKKKLWKLNLNLYKVKMMLWKNVVKDILWVLVLLVKLIWIINNVSIVKEKDVEIQKSEIKDIYYIIVKNVILGCVWNVLEVLLLKLFLVWKDIKLLIMMTLFKVIVNYVEDVLKIFNINVQKGLVIEIISVLSVFL